MVKPSQELLALARLHGVQLEHRDGFGQVTVPSRDTLVGILQAIGAPVGEPGDARDALREAHTRSEARTIAPVSVVFGSDRRLELGPAAASSQDPVEVRLTAEGGEAREWKVEHTSTRNGSWIELPPDLPTGYHRIAVEDPWSGGGTGGRDGSEGLLLVAPERAYTPLGNEAPPGDRERAWGTFLPLYALRSARNWGAGDLTDLAELARWTAELGGTVTGTLPLFASYLDEPLEPSPYAPVSRLFWNELYLDPTALPEWATASEARDMAGRAAFREDVERLRSSDRVRYRELAQLKSRIFDLLAAVWEGGGGRDSPAFRNFMEHRPEVERYAEFRAAMELAPIQSDGERPAWWQEGIPRELRSHRRALRHLYVQFRFHEQMRELRSGSPSQSAGLYLDLPLGTHPHGFDPWDQPELFAEGAALGAPPDGFHEGGQNWGLPPLRPDTSRRTGHQHLRDILGTLLPNSRCLRIDHVMGLHRLYWVPNGMDARSGAYVRYPEEELYAVLCIESHRHRTALIGEDLGTVPPGIRETMSRRGLRRMYVVPFERSEHMPEGLGPVPEGAAACLNTHDMPPFARYWAEQGESEPAERALERLLAHLGESPAGLVVVNVEDLWLEERAQNVPGTWGEENWTRKAARDLETFRRDPSVLRILHTLDRKRRGMHSGDGGTPPDEPTTRSRAGSGHGEAEG